MSFPRPLLLEYREGRQFVLIAEFVYETTLVPSGVVSVPAGFVTDFASIPRGLWNVLPPVGNYSKAAVVHDYLYRCCAEIDRGTCDRVFLEAMGVLGVSWLTRRTMYSALRMFGRRRIEA